jgi:opacity protein-like surface antigen
MKNILWICFLLFLFPGNLAAKDKRDFPWIEIFGGYSRFQMPRINLGIGVVTTEKLSLNGFNVAVTGNLNKWFGVDADFAHYSRNIQTVDLRSATDDTITSKIKITSFLVGPRMSYHFKRFTPFGHVLFGGAPVDSPLISGQTVKSFAYGMGGGVDINASRYLAVRAIQYDFINTGVSIGRADNSRLSFGAVFRY